MLEIFLKNHRASHEIIWYGFCVASGWLPELFPLTLCVSIVKHTINVEFNRVGQGPLSNHFLTTVGDYFMQKPEAKIKNIQQNCKISVNFAIFKIYRLDQKFEWWKLNHNNTKSRQTSTLRYLLIWDKSKENVTKTEKNSWFSPSFRQFCRIFSRYGKRQTTKKRSLETL